MKINMFGVVAGVLTLVVLAVSFFMPWWTLIVGENLLVVNASPVNTTFGALGAGFRLPLISALNLISALGLAASGLILLVYSFLPARPYSKHLLGFAYRKPLYILVGFIVGLVVSVFVVASFGVSLPLFGSKTVTLSNNLAFGATISVVAVAGFGLPFYLAILAVAFCLAARMYHSHITIHTEEPLGVEV